MEKELSKQHKTVFDIGSGAKRPMEDGVKLSRYACYLIVQNADAAKGAGVIQPLDYAIFQNHARKPACGR